MSNCDIEQNLKNLLQDITDTAQAARRNPDDVQLIAVSKTVSTATIQSAWKAGQTVFGENRAQELLQKAPELPAECRWHFIGHLQTNKVNDILPYAEWIHSVDRPRLLRYIDRAAQQHEVRPKVLLQVNMSGEETKFGVAPEHAESLLQNALEKEHLECKGLMTMAPLHADTATIHAIFRETRELRDKLAQKYNIPLPHLSMGMSADYRIAIREGATMVRIGSAVFGERHYQ